ncbi:MAG: hypothetical protein ABFC96_04485, partial [Thermoguttaceae bacterium]
MKSDEKKPGNETPKSKPAEKPAQASRLGREAKLGAAVIAALAVVLVAAVVYRVSRSGAEEKDVSASADAAHQKPLDRAKEAKRTKDDKLFGQDKLFPDLGPRPSASPTVVPAKADAGKPPRLSGVKSDPWQLPTERPEPRRSAHADPLPATPPLLMPEPSPKPLFGGPVERRRNEPSTPVTPKHRDEPRLALGNA